MEIFRTVPVVPAEHVTDDIDVLLDGVDGYEHGPMLYISTYPPPRMDRLLKRGIPVFTLADQKEYSSDI